MIRQWPCGVRSQVCAKAVLLAIFIAQALDIDVSLYHQVTLLLILLLTSKGAASVTGGAFILPIRVRLHAGCETEGNSFTTLYL